MRVALLDKHLLLKPSKNEITERKNIQLLEVVRPLMFTTNVQQYI